MADHTRSRHILCVTRYFVIFNKDVVSTGKFSIDPHRVEYINNRLGEFAEVVKVVC